MVIFGQTVVCVAVRHNDGEMVEISGHLLADPSSDLPSGQAMKWLPVWLFKRGCNANESKTFTIMSVQEWAEAVKQSNAAIKFAVVATGGTLDAIKSEVNVNRKTPGTIDVHYPEFQNENSVFAAEKLMGATMLECPGSNRSMQATNALASIRLRREERETSASSNHSSSNHSSSNHSSSKRKTFVASSKHALCK